MVSYEIPGRLQYQDHPPALIIIRIGDDHNPVKSPVSGIFIPTFYFLSVVNPLRRFVTPVP